MHLDTVLSSFLSRTRALEAPGLYSIADENAVPNCQESPDQLGARTPKHLWSGPQRLSNLMAVNVNLLNGRAA